MTKSAMPDQLDAINMVFRELASDPCYIVRRKVAGCIHEIVNILGNIP